MTDAMSLANHWLRIRSIWQACLQAVKFCNYSSASVQKAATSYLVLFAPPQPPGPCRQSCTVMLLGPLAGAGIAGSQAYSGAARRLLPA